MNKFNVRSILLFLLVTLHLVVAQRCHVPTTQTTEIQKSEEEVFSNLGFYDKFVILIGEKRLQPECRFIHFYNKLTNGYNVSEELCRQSLESTNMYKSKKTIFIHMPPNLVDNGQTSDFNLNLLDKVLNSTTNIKNDLVLIKYNCNDLELFADFNNPFNFETNIDGEQNLLQSFSVACVQTSGTDYDYKETVVNGSFNKFYTYFNVGETKSVACKKRYCSIFYDWKTSCKKNEINIINGTNELTNCSWAAQKYEFKTTRVTFHQKLSMHLIYDSRALVANINTYDRLVNKFYFLYCQALNITWCDDKLNVIGTSIPAVSKSVMFSYELERSENYYFESYQFCSYLYTSFYSKIINKDIPENLGNLCKRLNHLSSITKRPNFSNGFFNFELYKTFRSCITVSEGTTTSRSKPFFNIENESIVDAILKNNLQTLSHENLENWRKQVNIDQYCVSLKHLKLLYAIYVHHPPKMTKILAGSVCIFQGEFLSLTAVINEAHGCKSTVMMSNNTVFIDESRVKVVNFQAETELYIFAPRWIAVTSFQNFTNLWTRIYGVGKEFFDDTSSYDVQPQSDGFEITYNVEEPLKFREHYIVYLKSLKSNLLLMKCQFNKHCLYNADVMSAVHAHLSSWNNNNHSSEIHVSIPDYILSFEQLISNSKDKLDTNFDYVCQHIILTYRIQFSSIESQSNLIIDIERALLNFKELLDNENVKIKGAAYMKHINKVSKNYEDVIQSRIEESSLIIKNFHKKLDVTLKENEKSIMDLQSEVKNIQKQLHENKIALEKKKQDAEARLAAKSIYGIFSWTLNIISVFDPTGGIVKSVGAVFKAGSSLTTSLAQKIDTPNIIVPSGTVAEITAFSGGVISSVDIQINTFIVQIEDVKNTLRQSGSQRDKEVLDRVNEIHKQIRETQQNQNPKEEKLTVFIELRKQLRSLKTKQSRNKRETVKLESLRDGSRNNFTFRANNSRKLQHRFGRKILQEKDSDEIRQIEAVAVAVEGAAEFVDTVTKGEEEIDAINKDIANNENSIKQMAEFQQNLEDKLFPSVAKFSTSFSDNIKNLKDISKPLLIEMKFLLEKELHSLKTALSKVSSGFSVHAKVIETGEDLQNILLATLELHDDIDKNKKEIEHVEFLTQMFTPPDTHDIQDNATILMIDTLKQNVSQIVLRNNFKKVLRNMKQWSFPFVNHFIPLNTLTNIDYVLQNPTLLTESFKHIHEKYKEYKTDVVKKIDTHLFNADFVNSNFSLPFFTWTYDKFSSEIDNILAGNSTTLRASFDNSLHLPYNIIKFSYVKLEFTCDNATLCKQLNSDLTFYKVDMTHTGHSQYRCNNKVYTIYTESQTISYSIETSENGEPVHKNSVYDKMKNGDVLLSPYTFWRIQIKASHKESGFELLKQYMGKVNIALVGAGTYVNDGDCTFCTTALDLFYEPDYIL